MYNVCFLEYIKIVLFLSIIWIPSIIRDTFIIIITYSLSEKFKQLNGKLECFKEKVSCINNQKKISETSIKKNTNNQYIYENSL